MPNLIERGPRHTLRARLVARWQALAAGYRLAAPPTLDAGTAQRRSIGALHTASMNHRPVPQRYSPAPAANYSGETQAVQVILNGYRPELADTVAGVSAQGAGMAPVLPSTRRHLP